MSPPVALDRVIALLKDFVRDRQRPLEILLAGGLALQHYGMQNRITVDVDAEVRGDLEGLLNFLRAHQVPADLGENISGWSVVAMPPGYRDRAVTIHQDALLTIKALAPTDLVIAKLRRFTEEDIEDALFVATKHKITVQDVEQAAEEAVRHSIKDTALFLFQGNVRLFIERMRKEA
ncbi:MAG: DUF6036 family nucleotidyltransferase [Nitrospirota bacterium]